MILTVQQLNDKRTVCAWGAIDRTKTRRECKTLNVGDERVRENIRFVFGFIDFSLGLSYLRRIQNIPPAVTRSSSTGKNMPLPEKQTQNRRQ